MNWDLLHYGFVALAFSSRSMHGWSLYFVENYALLRKAWRWSNEERIDAGDEDEEYSSA
jgi:hypothetical protein